MAGKRGRPRKYISDTTSVPDVSSSSNSDVYIVSLSFNNETYTREGETLADAFDKFDNSQLSLAAKGIIIKTRSFLTVSKGDQKQTEELTGWQLRRFFANPVFRKLTAKRFAL